MEYELVICRLFAQYKTVQAIARPYTIRAIENRDCPGRTVYPATFVLAALAATARGCLNTAGETTGRGGTGFLTGCWSLSGTEGTAALEVASEAPRLTTRQKARLSMKAVAIQGTGFTLNAKLRRL